MIIMSSKHCVRPVSHIHVIQRDYAADAYKIANRLLNAVREHIRAV